MTEPPTAQSLDLGMRMVCGANEHPDTPGQTQAQLVQDEAWSKVYLSVPAFHGFSQQVHNILRHNNLTENCDLHRSAVLAVMGKLFLAGWFAGRQEVMDAEIKKLGTEAT